MKIGLLFIYKTFVSHYTDSAGPKFKLKRIGNGFQEVIYQRALAWEMTQRDLSFAREIAQEIYYKDLPKPIGTRRADFVVEDKVLVEIKAIIQLNDVHLAQVFFI